MRFIRLTLWIFLLTITLVSGASFYGRVTAKPNKLQQLGFDVCRGRPCFKGVTLDMAWGDAHRILTTNETPIGSTDDFIVLRIQNIDIAIRPDRSHKFIDGIDFLLWPDNDVAITISDIMALFGSPCNVTIFPLENWIEWIDLNYPEIDFTTEGVSPNSQITSLRMSKHSDISNCTSKYDPEFRANPWKGFRGLSYYMVNRVPQE
jgi:hypothetical protein